MAVSSSGIGHNALAIEGDLENSRPRAGYRYDGYPELPPVYMWRTSAGAALGTNPEIVKSALDNATIAVKWDHDETTTSPIVVSFRADEQFASEQTDMILYGHARKVDAAADENADLKLACLVAWMIPGTTTADVLSAILSAAVPAAGAGNATAYSPLSWDIGAALASAGKEIPRGAIVTIQVYPNEAVGTTDMDLELAAAWLRGRRHAAMKDRSKRFK